MWTISRQICVKLTLFLLAGVTTASPIPITKKCTAATAKTPTWKVVNGRDVNNGTLSHPHPYLVSLQWKANNLGYRHFCGGAILDKWTIITAAHCFYYSDRPNCWGKDPACYRLVAGMYDLLSQPDPGREQVSEFPSDAVQSHEKYDGSLKDYENDVALIHLKKPLNFSGYIRSVPLVNPNRPYSKFNAIIAGWGYSYDSQHDFTPYLQEAGITIHTNTKCTDLLKEEYNPETMMCASGSTDFNSGETDNVPDACHGDSGGPLIAKGIDDKSSYLVGIVSWGRDCGLVKHPGVYTKLQTYLTWIAENRRIVKSIGKESGHDTSSAVDSIESEEDE